MTSVMLHDAGGFTLTDRPVPTPVSDYAAARASLVDYLSKREDMVALFEYGSVAAPGLSDLDFIVVLANRPAPDIARYLDRAQLPAGAARAMARATLMVMSEEDFPHVTRWDDLRLVRRFGRAVDVVRLEGRPLFLTEICRIVDWLPWQIARLTRVIVTRRIPIATAIAWLYSLTYSLGKLEKVFGLSHDRWGRFREEIVDLRRSFFDDAGSVDERVALLVLEGHAVACDALRTFDEQVITASGIYGPPSATQGRLTVPGGVVLDFVAGPDVLSPQDLVAASTEAATIVHLPVRFIRHFATYASNEGAISRRLRAALAPPTSVGETTHVAADMREILEERIAACDRWAAFLNAHRFRSGLFKFAWFFDDAMPLDHGEGARA